MLPGRIAARGIVVALLIVHLVVRTIFSQRLGLQVVVRFVSGGLPHFVQPERWRSARERGAVHFGHRLRIRQFLGAGRLGQVSPHHAVVRQSIFEARRGEMIDVHVQLGGPKNMAGRAVDAAVDRLVYYAGWADKYEQVLGNVNPVASPHFNFTVTEPMGVVGVIAPDLPPLLPLISLIAPAIVSGNTVVALASEKVSYPAVLFGEMLATSDLPGGVVNILTGFRKELVPTFATHTHLRAVVGVANAEERKALKLGAAESVKRVHLRAAEAAIDWLADAEESVYAIRDLVEFKTTWHPVGA